MKRQRMILVVYFATVCAVIGCGPTKLQLTNVPGGGLEHGVLAIDAFTDQMKTKYVSTNPIIEVGPFQGQGEVVGFARARPVADINIANWPGGGATVVIPFQNEIAIPVSYWVLQGPFNTQQNRILTHIGTTAGIWNAERMGVAFTNTRFVDATNNPARTNFLAFDCTEQAAMQSAIGSDAGRINVYYVNTVDVNGSPGTGNGNACSIGSDFVAMGSATGTELLVHEIGHDMGLTHIDDLTTFDNTNVMFSASNVRQFLSEGQTFRAHLTSSSALNDTYNARAGQSVRNCPRETWDRVCPAIAKRLWSDGSFAPN